MIDRIYKTVLFISNNELRGNVAPHEFDLALYSAMLEIYEEYFYELSRHQIRANRGFVGTDFANIPDYIREKIRHYLESETLIPDSTNTGVTIYTLPGDLRWLDTVLYEGEEITEATGPKVFALLNKPGQLCVAKESGLYLQDDSQIQVIPVSINGKIVIWYLRNPKQPKWTYTTIDGTDIHNPAASDFQDVDMHISEEDNLTRRVLLKMGINLKEQDLVAYMNQQESEEFTKENS